MVRLVALGLLLLGLPLASVQAQPSGAPQPSVTVSPTGGDLTTIHQAVGSNFPANVPVVIALFNPSGAQSIVQARTDDSGSVSTTLQPPDGGWQTGIYRWVVALADGAGFSATFVADDGAPHLYALPYSPSPNSVFNFVGIGFPPTSPADLRLLLTGAGGQHSLGVTTDSDGTFSLYVWPQQFGMPFYSAGNYKILAPSMNLSTDFMVREHPATSMLSVDGPVPPMRLANLHFVNYVPNRYVWGIFADLEGKVSAEFLLPVDKHGHLDRAVRFPAMDPGENLLATPFDYGESEFTMVAPPPSATPTVTAESPPVKTGIRKSRSRSFSNPDSARAWPILELLWFRPQLDLNAQRLAGAPN